MSETMNNQILDKSHDIKSENTNIPIKEYIVNIRNKYYPDLDISFMDFFMEMYNSDDLISTELLSTYGVLSIRSNRKTLHCNDIGKLFKLCHLKEDEDFQCRQLAAKSRGAS